ncbi:bifunctional WD40-YVTN repeat-like-containing domain superfamily/WD40 repeat/Small-subunit processome [Babesia duncani]|uniref:Bifunctional WD40-YVTN repeat-like-containing domain superfamily/WD40 repeat/Small-subunit processome n=1 Tax=Babesia duncani TaxID=323732 RepID=A0AAD9PLU0_9APIC|nr:bifunctional WD40-YVTN repeat-like-containing domain superfamily/WD40 repeat/Small-subunit processome [Babesia duncani]
MGCKSIFKPNSHIGIVCDGKAVRLSILGSTAFVAVSKLRHFGIYEASTLRLSFLSLPLVANIRCIATSYENVFLVLENNSVYSFNRLENVPIEHSHTSDIIGIEVIDDVLLTYSNVELITYTKSESQGKCLVYKPSNTLQIPDSGTLEVLLPLQGFKNKVLIGYANGSVHLYNIVRGCVVFTFNFDIPQNADNLNNGISVFTQHQDKNSGIVAIGFKNGYVGIVDIATGQVLGGFTVTRQQSFATSIAFANDNSNIIPNTQRDTTSEVLLVGCHNGDLITFDLLNFKVFCVNESIHIGPIKYLLYIKRSNRIITAGNDNCLVQWSLDADKTFIKEVNSRRGFVGSVNFIIPYDNDELDLIVASHCNGVGYLGKASTIQEHQCMTFSTRCCKVKIKPITAISVSYQRHYDWPNIVTCHANSHVVRVWSGFRKCLVDGVLRVPGMDSVATSVIVTKCGNFAIVGYANGQLHLFHLQSCTHEDSFACTDQDRAHDSPIVNLTIIASTKLQSISIAKGIVIKTWDIKSFKLESQYNPEFDSHDDIITMVQTGKILTAFGSKRGKIYICDIIGRALVRTVDYNREILSMAFHPNGTWFLATATDSTMIVYDIVASCFVDFVKFSNPVISMHLSTCGSFLSTSLLDKPGMIHRYLNRHCFEIEPRRVLYTELTATPTDLGAHQTDDDKSDQSEQQQVESIYASRSDTIEAGLLTLSGLASGKLQNILLLDEIKSASKPLEPPRVQNELPFFIPTTYKDNQLVFLEPQTAEIEPKPAASRPSMIRTSKTRDAFDELVSSTEPNEIKFKAMLTHLANQTPAGIHLALSLLDIENEVCCMHLQKPQAILTMLRFFEYYITTRSNSDLVQVLLNVFLKYHGEAISRNVNPEICSTLSRISNLQSGDAEMLQEHFESISCYIKFYSHLQME